MNRPDSSDEAPDRRDAPGLRVKVYVRDDMIGMGKVDLLRLVEREGSVAGAAKAMGVDHERAWFLLDTLQKCFARPILVADRDRPKERAALTDLGRELIRRHDAHLAAVAKASEDFLEWLEAEQPPAADAPTASSAAS